MACCYFSINFCALSSSCCCIIVANLPSLVIMFSFLSRFLTSSSSSHCSAKSRWSSLEIYVLSFGGLEIAISAYHSWGELIYHLFRTDFLRSILWPIFGCQFQKVFLVVLQQCGEYCVVIGGRSTPFEISRCDIDIVDGAQCKCKHWFVFYTFLWTCRETDKSQLLGIFYRAYSGALKGL